MKSNEAAISFWLDDFDDIYSDFDSRHYTKRRVSEDFLHELAVSLEYNETKATHLALILPSKKRNLEIERNIVSSLFHFFQEQFIRCKEQYRKAMHKGLRMLISGTILMTLNFVLTYYFKNSLLLSLLRVLAEPGSWFLVWAGLDLLYYDLKIRKKKLLYFHHLTELKVHFQSTE